MAQVTMDSKEYLELIAAQRELEQIKKDMVEGFTFEYSPESWSNYRCKAKTVIPEDVKDAMAGIVVNACVNSPELMQVCWDEGYTRFNFDNMSLSRDWGSMEPNTVDLLEYPTFHVAFEKYRELNIPEEKEEE